EEAQSVVASGPLKGKTLHELWTDYREQVFGQISAPPDRDPGRESRSLPNRFPLLIKLLDAREKLSLQVHPPTEVAARFGGEPKTEFWYVAGADPGAELYVGLRAKTTVDEFRRALDAGTAADHLHILRVKAGDGMFLPSGRFHAIGGGNLLVEVQQNSDTTYRVFDWNRVDDSGKPRQLHVEQALASIDFSDVRPDLVQPDGETLVRHELFEVQKWDLRRAREIAAPGQFAIVCCLTGGASCAGTAIGPGEFMLVPASLADRQVDQLTSGTSILRITIPV
ncbi:MAG TPA: type I phosphomannose isomerase catalytic subunit, partial [Chthoniobacterales bacterium]|nr:type I phosphomannose isomerase catalytic subunit [Chthoniobacterales bacterium]